MLKRIIVIIILSLTIFSSFSLYVLAFDIQIDEAEAAGYYLYNPENNLVMAGENTDKLIFPSSTVKIMTACIALESGIDLDKKIHVTAKMIKDVAGRKMQLKSGDVVLFGDLLYAVICGGYNDAAHVIAFTVADSIQSFVDLMNQKATELAMTSTTYLNPTGIYVNGMRSTIGDIAILVSHMAKNEKFVEICSTKSYRISSESSCEYRTINNRSSLLSSYSGLSNFNTGSGDLGDCAVLYYNKNGHSLICIVMNAKSNDYNDNTNYAETFAKQLLNHALNDYSYKTVMDINTVVTTQTVNYSIDYSSLNVYLKNDLKVFVSDDIDVENDLSYSINLYNSTLKAPISAGDEVGTITVIYDGRMLATAPLIVKQDVSKNGLLFTLGLMREYFISRHFLLTIFTFILLLLGLYLSKQKKIQKMLKRRKKRRKIKK